MKRIIIIFIIGFCLLSFVEISRLTEELPSPGEAWSTFTDLDIDGLNFSGLIKGYYVRGFREGTMTCLNKLMPLTTRDSDIGIALSKLIDLHDFIWGHQEAVITVMDDLYKDPANTYIQYPSMCEIACQKLKGEDIEQLLKEARKEGYLHPLATYREYKKKIEK